MKLGFQAWSRGHTPRDIVGRWLPVATGIPIRIGEVTIAPGDYLVGDRDGLIRVLGALAGEIVAESRGGDGHREPGAQGDPRRHRPARGLPGIRQVLKPAKKMRITPTLNFPRDEYDERIAKAAPGDGGPGHRAPGCDRPLQHGLADRLRRLVVLRSPMRAAGAGRRAVWYGRGQDANGASAPVHGRRSIVGFPDHYVQSTERHPMEHLAGILGAGAGVGADRRRDGQLLLLRRRLRRAAAPAAEWAFADATGWSTGSGRSSQPTSSTSCARAARIVEAMHARIFESVEPGLRKCDLVAEIFRTGIRGVDGYGGDYPAIVPLVPREPTLRPRI